MDRQNTYLFFLDNCERPIGTFPVTLPEYFHGCSISICAIIDAILILAAIVVT